MAVSTPDFFRRVLTWPTGDNPVGFCNIHWTFPPDDNGVARKGMGGRAFQNLDQFMGYIAWANNHAKWVKDVYFCTSLQLNCGKVLSNGIVAHRHADNTRSSKILFVDLDVKEGTYATQGDALDALERAVSADPRLPGPGALVDSGSGGVHAYWIFNRALPIDEWQAYANGLRSHLEKHGLKFDAGVTTDSCRVLRVPGTFNKKQLVPRPVRLLYLAPPETDLDPARLDWMKGIVVLRVPRSTPITQQNLILFDVEPGLPPIIDPDYLAEIKTIEVYPPIDEKETVHIISHCKHLDRAAMTGGQFYSQPLWHLDALACTFLDKGREWFHIMSKNHKTYSKGDADAMYDRKAGEGIGWPSCHAFEKEGAECATCPFRGKIKSPLHLAGVNLDPTPPADEPDLPADTKPTQTDVQLADSLKLPPTYIVLDKKIHHRQVQTLADGRLVPKIVRLFKCTITSPWLEFNKGVHFTATTDKIDGEYQTVEVLIRDNIAGKAPAIVEALEHQRVLFSSKHSGEVGEFMSSWIEKLRDEMDAICAEAYGWFLDENRQVRWAYNGVAYGPDGERPASKGDTVLEGYYRPTGDINKWFAALKLVTGQKRPELEAILIASSFAAPLMRFTGLAAGCLCATSESGTNKSTAMLTGLAVWGNPQQTKKVGSTSGKYGTKTTGIVHHMPVCWDDMSTDDLVERVIEVMEVMTEGGEGGNLDRNRNATERGIWQTTMVVNTNMSMFDAIKKKTRDNIAKVSRVLEYKVQDPKYVAFPGRVDQHEATKIVKDLDDNYGHMGVRYSKLLGSASADIAGMIDTEMKELQKRIPAEPAERFWRALHVTIIIGGRLANTIGCNFDIPELIKFMDKIYLEMRTRVAGASMSRSSPTSVEDMFAEFYKEYSTNVLRTKNISQRGRGDVGVLSTPSNRDGKVHIQWIRDARLCRVSAGQLERWLRDENYIATDMIERFISHFKATKLRVRMTGGTDINAPKEQVLQFAVPEGTWLEEEMMATTPLVSHAIHSGQSTEAPDGFSNVDILRQ